jgi:hypothetical protein
MAAWQQSARRPGLALGELRHWEQHGCYAKRSIFFLIMKNPLLQRARPDILRRALKLSIEENPEESKY